MAQFVPIKLDVASDEYREWSREHPSEGNGIPKVYIVRADGETLYAKSGSLSEIELGQLLSTSLAAGGRILNEKEAALLIEVNDEMTSLREQGKVAESIKLLRKLRKFGSPDKIGSYASPVKAISLQLESLTAEGNEALGRIIHSLENAQEEKDRIAAIVDLLSAQDRFSELPTLKDAFSSVNRTITRDRDLRALLKGIKEIERAARASTDRARSSAIARLESSLEKHPTGELHDRIQVAIDRLKNDLNK